MAASTIRHKYEKDKDEWLLRGRELYYGAVQGKFVSPGTGVCGGCEWQCSGGLQPEVVVPQPLGYLAEQIEVVEDVGLAVSREECWCGEELEVQMWRGGVTAGSDVSQQLSS